MGWDLCEGPGCAVFAVAAAVFAFWPGGASAKPVQSTKYAYYTIRGDTAAEVYDSMMKKGPRVNGARAYASTLATTTQNGRLSQGSTCRIEEYRLKLEFVIKLPKIRNEMDLPAADRKRWQQFSAFLKLHEETHREIWLGCAADLERQVKAIKAKSCSEADRKANLLWDRIRAACNKKHIAFDTAEQARLMKHPFVKMIYNRSTDTHGASAE